MSTIIQQSAVFSASAQKLYDLYTDPKSHAEFTDGGAVKISTKPGSKFGAFGGMLSGTMLLAISGKQIVQRWRGTHWKETDADSILILTFVEVRKRARIDLVHVNVPQHDFKGVTEGWKKYYWNPLRTYLRHGKVTPPKM
jgi:activator of HSP90 ATPase